MSTIRNARGSDLIVTNEDETIFFGVQSKALSARHDVPIGLSLENLRSEWWVITMHANSDAPVCFVMALREIRSLAVQDKAGRRAYWLPARVYDCDEFRNAWERMGAPQAISDPCGTR